MDLFRRDTLRGFNETGLMGLLPSRDTADAKPLLSSIPLLRDAPKSALRAIEKDATHFSVPGGWKLFDAGETSDSLYFLISGALGAFRATPDGRKEFVGYIRAGEPVGEMTFISGEPHQNAVFALRDSELIKAPRHSFMKLMRSDPKILEQLTRIILLRLRQSNRKTPRRAEPKIYALVATSPTIDIDLRAKVLADSLKDMGLRVAISGEEDVERNARYFDDLEARHDVVLLKAVIGDSQWFRMTARYADRIWVLARADAHPSTPLMPQDDSPTRQFKLVDVVLLHQASGRRGAPPEHWASAAQASRVFHWQGLDQLDTTRLARVMAGRSVGLVLSGGGARAYAHIGAVRALREAGCPIDFAGGSSMGAVIAACIALGWDDAKIERRIRKAFVDSNPLGDYHLPVVSLVAGKRVDRRLEENFGDIRIEDLKTPFFAVSTNLTHGAFRVHHQGSLRHALRASIALPGILPPVIDDGEVLVDGAVLNNFPVDVMRDFHRGRIIGVDVARSPDGIDATDFIEPPGFFEWTLEHGFSSAPPIASLLMRTATLNINPNAGGELTDMLVTPKIEGVELRDWKSYDVAVEAGYKATKQSIAQLTGPLSKLVTISS